MDEQLLEYLKKTSAAVDEFVNSGIDEFLAPDELRKGTLMYFRRGGKRLRPALVSICAGLFGGEEKERAALPCAAGVELFHNWTLIHDDIIDNDDIRRGGSSVHKEIGDCFGSPEYGRDVAILAGDALHSMSIRLISRLTEKSVSAETALGIISICEGEYVNKLLCGETLDTKYGLLGGKCNEEQMKSVMLGKTGALFALCAVSGAMIGLGTGNAQDERLLTLKSFAENCGIAFQLKDDILGVTSDEKMLGKPIGSDVREGKNTFILSETRRRASAVERALLDRVVGCHDASKDDIERVNELFVSSGGVEYARKKADESIEKALKCLEILPDNRYRQLLKLWAESMSERNK